MPLDPAFWQGQKTEKALEAEPKEPPMTMIDYQGDQVRVVVWSDARQMKCREATPAEVTAAQAKDAERDAMRIAAEDAQKAWDAYKAANPCDHLITHDRWLPAAVYCNRTCVACGDGSLL